MDVHVKSIDVYTNPVYLNVSKFFRVENDLVFNGSLTVKGEDDRLLEKNSIVRGGEYLNWTGHLPVYEDSNNIIVPVGECNITVWDNSSNYWLATSIYNYTEINNNIFNTFTETAKETNQMGELFTINLTGIPRECDKTNRTFIILIDGDNVTFTSLGPDENAWQKNAIVYVGVVIRDSGGGYVDNRSVMHCISSDLGTTWSNWTRTLVYGLSDNISANDFVTFEDGDNNLIKWCASDTLGNGPTESKPYRILVDTNPIYFSNPNPLPTQESSTGEVVVGITISDNTSGVNTSTIKYSTSTNAGTTWSSWKSVDSFQNGNIVDVNLNLTFPNGTDNRIRWRANDIAGNGPTYSDEYVINVNIPPPPVIPKIKLVSPMNNSKITTNSVELSWEIVRNYHPGIVFDIKMDTTSPPQEFIEQDYTDTKLIVDELENGETYYWTVIPKLNNINGTCISDVWSFTVDIPLPTVTLLSPSNDSVISSTRPTLTWKLEYNGSSTIKYDIYFGTDKKPGIYKNNITTKYFSIDFTLKDNTTYYWKIVPWVGEYEGFSSDIWSFKVKLKDEQILEFGIDLTLDPNPLEIKPGEIKFVSATVTNLGELVDNFTVSISDGYLTKLNVEVYKQDTLEIEPGTNKEFLIMINIKEGTGPCFENITITATSRLAEKYNLEIQDNQVLMIKILEKDIQKEKERGQPISIFYFSILLLIIILIIISIIIVILVRKKSSKKDSKVEESQAIILETIPTPEPEPTLEPLSVVTQQQDETLEE
jgi:hypothetical protein